MWILSRKTGKTAQKFNAQYAEMLSLMYCSVPLSFPCFFWKFEVTECLGLKIGGGELRSLASYGTLTTSSPLQPTVLEVICHALDRHSECQLTASQNRLILDVSRTETQLQYKSTNQSITNSASFTARHSP